MEPIEDFESQCWYCANVCASRGYSGDFYEPPTYPEIEDCKAKKHHGGTMPDNKWDENCGIPVRMCPWFASKYPHESGRIRCPECNSPLTDGVETTHRHITWKEPAISPEGAVHLKGILSDEEIEELKNTIEEHEEDEEDKEIMICEHCGHKFEVDYWTWFGHCEAECWDHKEFGDVTP